MSRAEASRFFPRHPEKYVGNPQNIIARSSWERTFMQYCDTNPDIIRWASEELVVPYFFEGDQRWHRYYPDFLVHIKDGKGQLRVWMVEIKPYKQTHPPKGATTAQRRRQLKETLEYAKNQSKWAAAKRFCDAKGWIFTVVTEKELFPPRS